MQLLIALLAAQAGVSGMEEPGSRLIAPPIVRDCRRDERRARASGDEILVCGSRDGDSPYRAPRRDHGWDPAGPVKSVSRERNGLLEGLESGLGSCTNVGPGGMTGCLNKGVWRKREQYGR